MTAAPAVVAGRWEVVRPLGRGSFGHTYLARELAGDRLVALKLLDPQGGNDWKARELFEREAAVLRSLRHQGIPEVLELVADTWSGAPALFLVMEYVEGDSLAVHIDERRTLEPAEVVHLFLEMLGILEYLHGRVPPILHRDIKPSNIVVRPDGAPVLVDFGSVRRVHLAPDESGSTVVGTYGYMPYEQYMGQATPSSDLYALAATFLHLLTGRAPREFMTQEGRIEVPEPLPGDSRLGPILARLLLPSPAERYASAREVRQAILAPAAATAPAPLAPRRTSAAPGAASRAVVRSAGVDPALLGPAPRPIEGAAKMLVDLATPSAWELMDSAAKRGDRPGVLDWMTFAFFSAITFGVVPMVFFGMTRARRRRLQRFVRDGIPVVADVLGIEDEQSAFGEKVARVSYEFEAGGERRRDVDRITLVVAQRWQPGDRVLVLYIPEQNWDSVIVSTG